MINQKFLPIFLKSRLPDNLQIASKIQIVHPTKPKKFTLTREWRSPGNYEHRDVWEGGWHHYDQSEVTPDFTKKQVDINIWDFLSIFQL